MLRKKWNSNWNLRKSQKIIKTRDLAEHCSKYFKASEFEPELSPHHIIEYCSTIKIEYLEKAIASSKKETKALEETELDLNSLNGVVINSQDTC